VELDTFNYRFKELFFDVLGSDIPPEDVHKEIKKIAQEQYHYHKHLCGRAYEFLALFNDQDDIEGYEAAIHEREYYEGWDAGIDTSLDELNQLRTYDQMIKAGYTMTDDGFWIKETSETITSGASISPKNEKWTLPVEVDGLTGDCLVTLPDDLLEKVGWKENDRLEWVDRGDGSFELRKA
jgi:hypothetical protein